MSEIKLRLAAKNLMLKLYDLGEITFGNRQQFTLRYQSLSEHGNLVNDYVTCWTLDSIEHQADLLIAKKQREIAG